MASQNIHEYIMRLPLTQIFTTRELLPFGTRSAVDQTLYRMVKSGFLTRLAFGVFIRDKTANPSLEEIALAKLTAYGKRIVAYAEKTLSNLKIQSAPDSNRTEKEVESTFAIDAHSSSFDTVRGRVYLRGIGTRKFKLCETAVGQIVYALWHKTSEYCEERDIRVATQRFGRNEQQQLRRAAALMPTWLNKLCLAS